MSFDPDRVVPPGSTSNAPKIQGRSQTASPHTPRPAGPRLPYPSDLTNDQWELIRPLLPTNAGAGRPPTTDFREVVDALFYLLREGCTWRALPHDFPPWGTVQGSLSRWCRDGTWQRIHDAVRDQARAAGERDPQPTAAALDSQSVKTTAVGGAKRFDAGKKVKGRKRHLLVDRMGLLLAVVVHSAGVQDCRGAQQVLMDIEENYPKLEVVWADGWYRRMCLLEWVTAWGVGWRLELVERPPGSKGSEVQPQRWVVERTFGWLNRYRRLSKDYERLTGTSGRVPCKSERLFVNEISALVNGVFGGRNLNVEGLPDQELSFAG